MGIACHLVELKGRLQNHAEVDCFAPLDHGGVLPYLSAPACLGATGEHQLTPTLTANAYMAYGRCSNAPLSYDNRNKQ